MMITHKQIIRAFIIAWCCAINIPLFGLSSLAKNDPYPVYNTLDPHTFLYTYEKLKVTDPKSAERKHDNVGLSIAPFGQNADRGRNLNGVKVPLGDLTGRWSMLALMFGPTPTGKTMAPTLQTALTNLFPGVAPGDLNDGSKIDPAQNFGFFSVPLKYRKRGIRFELAADIYAGFGLSVQTGIVSMTQTSTGFLDQTGCDDFSCPFDPVTPTRDDVRTYLMHEWKTIAKEIQLDIGSFCETSVEEVRINLFWRRGFELNRDEEDESCHPHFLLIPFFMVSGGASPGDEDRIVGGFNKAFFTPFGNNDHNTIGFTAGLNFDFVDTVEIGGEVGVTHFFSKNFEKFRLPTSEWQSGVYPFFTDVRVSPGFNWHFGAKISSYHFLECLSGYFEYIQVRHSQDKIELRKCEDQGIFFPNQLEVLTGFEVKLVNAALNYDISPNINLGIMGQIPLSQKNAYRSSTILFSFAATF
ncbi:hypothetical protein E3J61_01195 [Candidatus Dependentiae bacterium]|nr:MAG: hypothetical protein E3J61_01195 [Candidatus Dependentiae bacterium]